MTVTTNSLSHEELSLVEEIPDSQPLTIGIICPYSFETPGGVQAHIKDFAQELITRGHSVSVLAPGRRTKDMPLWVQTTNTSFAVPYNGSVAHISYFGFVGNMVRWWVRQGQFDILHVHEPEIPSLSHKIFTAGFHHPPVVATFHTSFEEYPLALKVFEKYLNRYLIGISQAIFVSDSAQDIARHYLDSSIRQSVIPNGIHTSFFRQARSKEDWQGTSVAPTIGFLGRIGEERKGFPVFCRAIPSILAAFPQARFLCAGDGEGEGKKIIHSLADSTDQDLEDRVTFLGRISDEDKARFYKSLSVYVAPQTGGESFGIVLAEAMAAGCPVVASDLQAFVDVSQHGACADLFAAGQAESLSDAVCSLLSQPDKALKLSKAGLTRAQDFDWKTVTDDILQIYRRILDV